MSSCYILDSFVVWPSDKMEVLLVSIFVKGIICNRVHYQKGLVKLVCLSTMHHVGCVITKGML